MNAWSPARQELHLYARWRGAMSRCAQRAAAVAGAQAAIVINVGCIGEHNPDAADLGRNGAGRHRSPRPRVEAYCEEV